MLDLWPEDIGQATATATPLSVLKEQAAALGRKTNNVVVGDVRQSEGDVVRAPAGWFEYDFDIVGPVLGNYRYGLLSIAHPVELYPVRVFVGDDLLNGIPKAERRQLHISTDLTQHIVAHSQESLEKTLRLLFSSSKTKRVIQAIIAQSVAVGT